MTCKTFSWLLNTLLKKRERWILCFVDYILPVFSQSIRLWRNIREKWRWSGIPAGRGCLNEKNKVREVSKWAQEVVRGCRAHGCLTWNITISIQHVTSLPKGDSLVFFFLLFLFFSGGAEHHVLWLRSFQDWKYSDEGWRTFDHLKFSLYPLARTIGLN